MLQQHGLLQIDYTILVAFSGLSYIFNFQPSEFLKLTA